MKTDQFFRAWQCSWRKSRSIIGKTWYTPYRSSSENYQIFRETTRHKRVGITSVETLQEGQNLRQLGIQECGLLIAGDQRLFKFIFIFCFHQDFLEAWQNDMYAEDFSLTWNVISSCWCSWLSVILKKTCLSVVFLYWLWLSFWSQLLAGITTLLESWFSNTGSQKECEPNFYNLISRK